MSSPGNYIAHPVAKAASAIGVSATAGVAKAAEAVQPTVHYVLGNLTPADVGGYLACIYTLMLIGERVWKLHIRPWLVRKGRMEPLPPKKADPE